MNKSIYIVIVIFLIVGGSILLYTNKENTKIKPSGKPPTIEQRLPTATSNPTIATTPLNIDDSCGHNIDPNIINIGFNEVVDADGKVKEPQGRPLQQGDTLQAITTETTDNNKREYARVASYMMQIRDALMCDIANISETQWSEISRILTLNGIKTKQDLSGTPKDQVYSTDGIYEHLKYSGPDTHPMMKYLEEAELELKCLALTNFDFTNPEGDNHCEIHNLTIGSGLILPN